MMMGTSPLVPLSHAIGNGTAGQTPLQRDIARDTRGTNSLKDLAKRVLSCAENRDKLRDKDEAKQQNPVPLQSTQWDKHLPAEIDALDAYHERLAIMLEQSDVDESEAHWQAMNEAAITYMQSTGCTFKSIEMNYFIKRMYEAIRYKLPNDLGKKREG